MIKLLIVPFLQLLWSCRVRGISIEVAKDQYGNQYFLPRGENDTIYCFSCNNEKDGDKCKDFYNNTMKAVACPITHKCQIWHFYSLGLGTKQAENSIETYYFERSCILDCNPGVVPLDDMGNRFVSYTWCCNESYCNMGNTGQRISNYDKRLIAISLMLVVKMYQINFIS